MNLDADCPAGLSDGTGPGLIINANLIQANSADSGSGGGIRMNQVNGTDVSAFPTNSSHWNSVSIANNIINNNLAGWDGAGISLQDSINVRIVSNTIANNDSLASSGVLTQSLGTPMASAPAGNCVQTGPTGPSTASCPQAAGVASTLNSSLLTQSLTTTTGAVIAITCPTGQPNCQSFSDPVLADNIIWQNRSFQIGISGAGTGTVNQQNLVSLYDAVFNAPGTTTGGVGSAAPTQTFTGECGTGVSYWDIGVRGDAGPAYHNSGFTLNPISSVLTSTAGYGATNKNTAPTVVAQYCNGARVAPECSVADGCGGPSGYGVPPGIVDATTPNPVFSLTPAATVDEGNNWINVAWGPLSLSNDAVNTGATDGNYGGGGLLANYNLTSNFLAVNSTVAPPSTDFNNNARPSSGFNPGAVEYQSGATGPCSITVTPTTLAFGNQADGTTSAAQSVSVHNGCATSATGGSFTFGGGTPQPFSHPTQTGACGATLAGGATCSYNVVFSPPNAATQTYESTLSVAYTGLPAAGTLAGSPVTLTGTGTAVGTLSFISATNGTLGTVLGVRSLTLNTATSVSVVTIENTGAGGLGITAETLTNILGTAPKTATTCSFTAPLAAGATCTVTITGSGGIDFSALAVANNGSGTIGGNSTLTIIVP